MYIDFLLDVFRENKTGDAVVWKDEAYDYGWLLKRYEYWKNELIESEIINKVVILNADYSPNSIALLLALIENGNIIAPVTAVDYDKIITCREIVQNEIEISIDKKDNVEFTGFNRSSFHPLYKKLKQKKHPGLILFSSGSEGKTKAALHDFTLILEKFKIRKKRYRTLTFLMYDHIGGINTMFYVLSNGGCIIAADNRNPDYVLKLIEKERVELLPTSPTFLSLILLSESYLRYDLSSLKVITYGTEPMSESLLKRLNEIFADVKLQQTYGLSEVGILRSKSKSSDSLWLKIGGEGYQTRVVDGMLEIKARSAMLGFLNAPSPFTQDGWFRTGDRVEQDGDYIRIIGRQSELINVGGEKVYPEEIEEVIRQLDGVAEVTVYGEVNPITGHIVCADIKPETSQENVKEFIMKIRKYCRQKLAAFKRPVKIKINSALQYTERFKKKRKR